MGNRKMNEDNLDLETRQKLLMKVVHEATAEVGMNYAQQEHFISHILHGLGSEGRTDFSKTHITDVAEAWMNWRGWRDVYGGNNIDPRQ